MSNLALSAIQVAWKAVLTYHEPLAHASRIFNNECMKEVVSKYLP